LRSPFDDHDYGNPDDENGEETPWIAIIAIVVFVSWAVIYFLIWQ
jgi:hypothetical protein